MVLFIQYPICDTRGFIPDSGKLSQPTWPSPISFKNFVKFTGQVVPRASGGVAGWLGEDVICRITNAIRFRQRFPHRAVSSHLYHDGLAVSKYEFVFACKIADQNIVKNIDSVLCSTLRIKTDGHNSVVCRLSELIPHLKKLYFVSTTRSTLLNREVEKHIIPCKPIILIYAKNSHYDLPRTAKKKTLGQGDSFIAHWWYKFEGIPYRLIFIYHNSNYYSNELLRGIRISLQRLHTEYECLQTSINSFVSGKFSLTKGSKESDLFQHYINSATKRISKDNRALGKHALESEIDAFSKYSFEKITPGQYQSMMATIKNHQFRGQIESKIYNHLRDISDEKNVIVMGDQYINKGNAGYVGRDGKIENTTINQVDNKTINEIDLVKLGEELTKLRNELNTLARKPEQFSEMGEIASAEVAAKSGDRSKVLKHLCKAGQWALDVATKIGVTVAAAAIKASMA